MTTTPVLQVRSLDARACVPSYQTSQAAGLDLSACLPRGDCTHDTLQVGPGSIVKVPTGLAIALPDGHEGQVRPRSGLATRHGLTVVNAPGTIDADYRGELFVALINLGREPVEIAHGDRIAQLVVAPVTRAAVIVVNALDATARGSGGFGSTGTANPAAASGR